MEAPAAVNRSLAVRAPPDVSAVALRSQARTRSAGRTSGTTGSTRTAAAAYLDLLREYGALGINADTLARAEQMLERAGVADKAGLSKTAGDINRARTEVELRRQERITL